MKILFKIIKSIVTAFLFVVLLLVMFQKFSNNQMTLGNIYVFQVASQSMLPEYRVGDIIVVKKVESSELKIGDDVTYMALGSDFAGLTITHRIISKRNENGKYYFITKGIANTGEDPEISGDNIYGKVVYHTILFSFVGRLMTNMIVYYLLFMSVGVAFSYEIITTFFMKEKSEEEILDDEDEILDDTEEDDSE